MTSTNRTGGDTVGLEGLGGAAAAVDGPNELALLSLVQGAVGKSWSTSLHGWTADSGIPACDWDGVTCRSPQDGSAGPPAVVELNLPFERLSGTIPSELGELSDLEVLTLKNNMLRGSIPQEIANLKKLTRLDLEQCFLTGTLPQRFESPQLASLVLANNAISGRFFRDLDSPHLSSIREIRMENNLLTGTLHGPTLATMPNLKTLSLSDNDFSGLIPGEGLGSLTSLHHLYLDSNHFVGPLPAQLAQVGKAQILELWVQDNALSGTVPASYARFDQLHDFYIDGNKLTGAIPPAICGPHVNEDFFEHLPPEAERGGKINYCDSIACPAGSVAPEGLYPCEDCPGGEAARLKNRYIGQQGKCIDHSQHDVLRIFREATTKGGPWSGVDDWADPKPVCDMTGVGCDSHGNVVAISLRGRGLQGHIPDVIGELPFLETLDLADNELMGYVPGDLRWTSLTKLDISGNRIRGMIPPLLCKMEELNGNGKDNVFQCDRIACPSGTFNAVGFRHGVDGEKCVPCFDDSPYIAQKSCNLPGQLDAQGERPRSNGKDGHLVARETHDQNMGASAQIGLAILGVVVGMSLIAVLIIWAVKRIRSSPRTRRGDDAEDALSLSLKGRGEDIAESSSGCDEDRARRPRYRDSPPRRDQGSGQRADEDCTSHHSGMEEEFDNMDDYSFKSVDTTDRNLYRTPKYRDTNRDEIYEEDSDSDDGDVSDVAWSQPSASDFVRQHQGIALGRREKLIKVASGRMPEKVRDAAASINVGARRKLHEVNMRRMSM